jgi:hypothetical protein
MKSTRIEITMRNGTNVDDIIMTSLFLPLGMFNAILPTSITCGLSRHWQVS